jgi:hypothetical protein
VKYLVHVSHSVLEHVVSNQAQPHAHNERAHSEIRGAVLRALNTLPEDESRAIHERLGLGERDSILLCSLHLFTCTQADTRIELSTLIIPLVSNLVHLYPLSLTL